MPSTPHLDLVPDPGTGLTPADRRRAALAACSYATDAAEARELLDALGLLEELRDGQGDGQRDGQGRLAG